MNDIKQLQAAFYDVYRAAEKIQHWSDAGDDGMIVSASSVRDLWSILEDYKYLFKDVKAKIEEPVNPITGLKDSEVTAEHVIKRIDKLHLLLNPKKFSK